MTWRLNVFTDCLSTMSRDCTDQLGECERALTQAISVNRPIEPDYLQLSKPRDNLTGRYVEALPDKRHESVSER